MQNVKLYVCERTFSTNVAFMSLKLLLPVHSHFKIIICGIKMCRYQRVNQRVYIVGQTIQWRKEKGEKDKQ